MSSFPIYNFSCSIALGRASSVMLAKSGERWYPSLISDHNGKLQSCTIRDIIICSHFVDIQYSLSNWGNSPLCLVSWEFFIMNALYSVKYFLLSIDVIMQDNSWLPCSSGEVQWFFNIKSMLHTRNKLHLIMMYNSYILLSSFG